jgi:hypothetical protein
MEQQDRNRLSLTTEQAAEVRRRLANPSRDRISAEDVFRRFRSRKAMKITFELPARDKLDEIFEWIARTVRQRTASSNLQFTVELSRDLGGPSLRIQ